MADPIRFLQEWPGTRGQRVTTGTTAAFIIRQDPLRQSSQLIARHEFRVWFEPNWGIARQLARRFPHCVVYSIPIESNTPSLHRIPAWRPRRAEGIL